MAAHPFPMGADGLVRRRADWASVTDLGVPRGRAATAPRGRGEASRSPGGRETDTGRGPNPVTVVVLPRLSPRKGQG